MDKKIYDLMDWAAIEAVVYGETDEPQKLLGAHTVGRQTLVQGFFPGAKKAVLYIPGAESAKGRTVKEEVKMELVDEAGYFAALLSGKNRRDYYYHVEYETDKLTKTGRKSMRSVNYQECYGYENLITEKEAAAFVAGTSKDAYQLLGSKLMTIGGVRGCRFAVWAPNALRVSIAGDFNDWNPLMHPMMRSEVDGIFELFLPGVEEGDRYKYQILAKGQEPFYKADPCCFQIEKEEGRASVVTSLQGFAWEDSAYLKARKKLDARTMPYNAYELRLDNLPKEKSAKEQIAWIIDHVKKMHYTHVELMPVQEAAKKETAGFSVTEFFALSNTFGTLDDYRRLVNALHKEKIGVIVQWPMQSFDESPEGLARFDGSGLYEDEDSKKGIDPRNGHHMFLYGRPEVASFLTSNAAFFAEELHADGLKFCDLASILYLDYYRSPGEWMPNIYGGNENLDSIDFVKSINEMLHKEYPGFLTIAEDESCWPNVTARGGNRAARMTDFEPLGFDFAMDFGYNADLLDYMRADPIRRRELHDKLTMFSVYQYNETFLLPVMHQNTGSGRGGLLEQMPGEKRDQIANLKAMYGLMMMRTGKKQMYFGQDYGAPESFAADTVYDFGLAGEEGHKELLAYCQDLNRFYLEHPWLYSEENEAGSFAWINEMSANENVISFQRKGRKDGEEITVILNFANTEYSRYRFGSDGHGRYKEIFSSDKEAYYGAGRLNGHLMATREDAYDGRPYSFNVTLPPLSMVILSFTPYTDKELKEIREKKELRDKVRQQREEEREKRIAEKEELQKKLAEEKAKIRAELKKELERRYLEAEEKIYGKGKKRHK